MIKLLGSTMLLCVMGAATASAAVVLGSNHPDLTPLEMTAGDATSSIMTVGLSSNALDDLSGWGVLLDIVPLGGATGSVAYNSASPAAVDYVFAVPQTFFNATLQPGNVSLTAFDAGFPVVTTTVPGPPGLNLLDLTFSASPDASGMFGIIARGGVGNSEWSDPIANANLFANVGDVGQSAQIGKVVVVIPEPSSFLLTLLVTLSLIPAWHIRARLNRN